MYSGGGGVKFVRHFKGALVVKVWKLLDSSALVFQSEHK
jgi:hypothetical protein